MVGSAEVGRGHISTSVDGSGIEEGIIDAFEDAAPEVEKQGDKAGKTYGRRFSSRFQKFLKDSQGKAGEVLARRLGEAGDKAGDNFASRTKARLDRAGDRIGRSFGDRIGESMSDRIEIAMLRASDNIADRIELSMARVQESIEEGLDRPSGGGGQRGPRVPQRDARYNRIGRLFGAGSRNNFLNFAGRSVANLTRLIDGSFRALGRFGQGFRAAGIDASFFQKTVGGFRSMFAGFGGALAATAKAAPAVAIALAALVSVASALIAILTALTATIVSGITAALTIFTVTATAAVAAGGLLVAAFMSMTDAQKALLKDAFVPLREMMVGIGQVMIKEMVPAFATWSKNLQEALLLIGPLAQVMGKAFAEAGNIFTDALSGPGFQRFSEALTVYLPNIVTRLTSALGGFLNGLLGMFSAMMPFVNQFAEYLDRVATRFSDWANSASGQNTIVNWTTRAVESLKSLWNFVREFTGFVTDVLFSPEAQSFGNSMFDSLADSFAGFRRSIADGSLERWFSDAIQFGEDLWSMLTAVAGALSSLYDSGVLTAVGTAFGFVGSAIEAVVNILDPFIPMLGVLFAGALAKALLPLQLLALAVVSLGEAVEWVGGLLNKLNPFSDDFFGDGAELDGIKRQIEGIGRSWQDTYNLVSGNPIDARINVRTNFSTSGTNMYDMTNRLFGGNLIEPSKALAGLGGSLFSKPTVNLYRNLGRNALANTTSGSGSGSSAQPKYNNPYTAWANSLIKETNTIAIQIRKAMADMTKQVRSAMTDAAGSLDGKEVIESLRNLRTSLREQGTSLVDAAQNTLNSAARSLANASSPEAARDALREVKKAQQDLAKAQAAQKRLNAATNTIAKQVLSYRSRIDGLISDSPWERAMARTHATLADYAAARGILAERIAEANDRLADAISLRDDMRDAVTGSIQAFGALTTATAQVVNGVTQALTATDITTNLQDRLDKIQNFQNNLRMLAAQGLSDAAYRQIVDAGVEEGSALAEALLGGGAGAIQQTNQLVGQINSLADNLGVETSNRMYQAGVHAAQGLVDGLTSLDAQLASAATQLGNTIANSIKRSLGIASPARRMIQDMESVGDGIVVGLGNQHNKVGAASASLANRVSVSPEVAAYAARQGTGATVSGNGGDPRFRDLVVHTPTENPEAVAREVLNEITGRL